MERDRVHSGGEKDTNDVVREEGETMSVRK
jgi:hypothetical protein